MNMSYEADKAYTAEMLALFLLEGDLSAEETKEATTRMLIIILNRLDRLEDKSC